MKRSVYVPSGKEVVVRGHLRVHRSGKKVWVEGHKRNVPLPRGGKP